MLKPRHRCTAPYRRGRSDKASELQRYTAEEVLRLVRDAAAPAVRAVVVTGGEPLLHAKPLQKIVPQLVDDGFKIEFETNGTLTPSGVHRDVHFNVSPKLANSHQSILLRMNYRILEEYLARNSSVFKFVVRDYDDLDEIQHIVKSVGIDPARVFLMPEGTVRYGDFFSIWIAFREAFAPSKSICFLLSLLLLSSALTRISSPFHVRLFADAGTGDSQARGRWLAEVCVNHGFNYSHRIHVELWGAKRGV